MPQKQGFQPISEDTLSISKPIREAIREPLGEVRELLVSQAEFEKAPKSSSELAAHFGCTKEAIQDWVKIIAQAYCWRPITELKSGIGKNTRYSPFCIQQMCNLKDCRESGQTATEWIAAVHQQNAGSIADWKASQLPKEPKEVVQPEAVVNPPQVIGGLMNLPNLSPVETSIVPQNQAISTDTNPAKDLAVRSDDLLQGLEEIEQLKQFLKGASAVADSYIEKLEKITEEEERQAKEVEELAFELEVKSDYIKRAEVRKSVIEKEAFKTKTVAASKVANFASFFAKRAQGNASS
jgi:hypothetical protein